MAYCVLADVQALIPKYTLGASTTPTSTQAQGFIDIVAGEIDMILAGRGHSVPVTDPAYLVTFLKGVNAYGAAVITSAAMFPGMSQKDKDASWVALEDRYNAWMEKLETGDLSVVSGESNVGSLYTAAGTDQDNYPDPIFRISSDDKEF